MNLPTDTDHLKVNTADGMTFIIMLTAVPDQRFPGRRFLIGEVGGARFYASFCDRRAVAENAIRRAFVDAYQFGVEAG